MSAPYNFASKTMKEIKKPSDMPDGACFVIQFFDNKSIFIEGDERSRTNPGHGYPAHTENYLMVQQFATTDEAEWKQAIWALLIINKSRSDFVAYACNRAKLTTEVKVEVVVS